jgi:hypothetical protein
MTSYMYNGCVYLGKGQVKCSTDNGDYTYPWKVLWIWGRLVLCWWREHNGCHILYFSLRMAVLTKFIYPPVLISCITEWCRRVGSAPVFIFRRFWFRILAQTLSIAVAVFEFTQSYGKCWDCVNWGHDTFHILSNSLLTVFIWWNIVWVKNHAIMA